MEKQIVKGKIMLVVDFTDEFPSSWNYNEIEGWLIDHFNKYRNDDEEIIVKIENVDEVEEDECN